MSSPSLAALAGDELSRETLVQTLLAPGGIRTVFQPLVRLNDGRTIGYEALSRSIADPRRPPDAWLRDAEACGVRIEVELACLRAAAKHGPLPGAALMFVNVSHRVMLDARFDKVRRSLPPHVLELTEHEPVSDYPELLAMIEPWSAEGTLLAIDDVGSGYSSMAHVLRLAPSFIKIDRDLVANLDASPQQRSLVAALVAFARGLHATSIAEGVETAAELDALRTLQVDVVQGYLLGRPGEPWVQAADPVRGREAGSRAANMSDLRKAVALTTHAQDAAACVTRFLTANSRMMPSIYLAQDSTLRCLSRHGQWLILDGIPAGVGITGSCFERGEEIFVADVYADPRYRAAIPGVRSEFAVPIVGTDGVLGVLNVDAVGPMDTGDLEAIRECGRLLADRLLIVGDSERKSTALRELSRRAPWLAAGGTPKEVAVRALTAVSDVAHLDSAALWVKGEYGGELRLLAKYGAGAERITGLTREEVASLDALAGDLASCYSAGNALDLAFGPTAVLRDRGATGMVLAPLRDGSRRVGLLCAIGGSQANIDADTVEAIELMCLHAGSRLAALDKQQQLDRLLHRDLVTGLSNRQRFDALRADRRGSGSVGWVLLANIDRFAAVNRSGGPSAGDDVLRAVAGALGAVESGPDRAFRLGNDEFAVLLTAQPLERAEANAERARRDIRTALRRQGLDVSVTVTAVSRRRDGIDAAYQRATDAMDALKRAGGAEVRVLPA